jgi:hypothetical protein
MRSDKVLLAALMTVVMKTGIVCCNNNNKIKGNEELTLVILNCILLHNQNNGWTLP